MGLRAPPLSLLKLDPAPPLLPRTRTHKGPSPTLSLTWGLLVAPILSLNHRSKPVRQVLSSLSYRRTLRPREEKVSPQVTQPEQARAGVQKSTSTPSSGRRYRPAMLPHLPKSLMQTEMKKEKKLRAELISSLFLSHAVHGGRTQWASQLSHWQQGAPHRPWGSVQG